MGNFAVDHMVDGLGTAPNANKDAKPRTHDVLPTEEKIHVCLKIQSQMDPNHRDRIAFCRIVAGSIKKA